MRPENTGFRDVQATAAIAVAAFAIGAAASEANTNFITHYHSSTNTEHVSYYPHASAANFVTTLTVSLEQLLPYHHSEPKSDHHKPKPQHHKPTPEQVAEKVITPKLFAQWLLVHNCEESKNGWHYEGETYAGGLGISRVNWVAYGGLKFAKNGGLATPVEQDYIGHKMAPITPDQDGCWPGGW